MISSRILWLGLVVGCAGPVVVPRASGFPRIDTHVHVFTTAPEYQRLLERLDLRVLNICVLDRYERGYEEIPGQHAAAARLQERGDHRVAWASTFDYTDWENPGFAARAIARLDETFAHGAVAVKIYKDIGMELRSRDGTFLMPDDPVFDPIYKAIAARGKTLLAHLAEPDASWKPLDPKNPHYGYYKSTPAWYMYDHPERPAKAAILAARDRLLKNHPNLRVVGLHLGSMEDDVAEITKRLDAYPNFAVDTAARMTDLMLQPRERVKDFLVKYQDRVLYATDVQLMSWDDPAKKAASMEAQYARDWKYLATGETMTVGGRTISGLALPDPVLRKLYYENAIRWVPGIN